MKRSHYPESRLAAFDDCKKALKSRLVASTSDFLVVHGDSLELLEKLSPECVSLVLTDPPYHTTQKKNIQGDTQFKSDDDFLGWISAYANQWQRVLRKNGSLYVFCSTKMSARIEVDLSSRFNALSHVTWTKPNDPGYDGWKGKASKTSLRTWYPHSERVLFFEPAYEGNLRRSTFGAWLRKERTRLHLSTYDLAEVTESYGAVNHGGAVSNWEAGRNIPSREQFSKIVEAFKAVDQDAAYPDYEDVVRPFSVHVAMEFTDTWHYPSVKPYKGKHPAEKPVEMLESIVEASSYEHDIVLDCFGGSGSSGEAAVRCGRKAIIIEIDKKWCEVAASRLHAAADQPRQPTRAITHPKRKAKAPQLSLLP